jgi:tRNA threonylcarbamoyladenosine biosynthesis protein TsaE
VTAQSSVQIELPTLQHTNDLGQRLGRLLRAGDLVLLSGELGAGKTALTKAIATGMGVQGTVASPTFVIARVHRGSAGGPSLVHVDAYRLGGRLELDDLDLDADLQRAAVVVEWGEGVAEQIADEHLLLELVRLPDDRRTATFYPSGTGWEGRLQDLLDSVLAES